MISVTYNDQRCYWNRRWNQILMGRASACSIFKPWLNTCDIRLRSVHHLPWKLINFCGCGVLRPKGSLCTERERAGLIPGLFTLGYTFNYRPVNPVNSASSVSWIFSHLLPLLTNWQRHSHKQTRDCQSFFITRNQWGCPLPDANKHIIYGWF